MPSVLPAAGSVSALPDHKVVLNLECASVVRACNVQCGLQAFEPVIEETNIVLVFLSDYGRAFLIEVL